jgi:hypothetical protein
VKLPEPESTWANRLCSECVGEPFLKKLIQIDGMQHVCSYCDEEGPSLSIEEVADLLEYAFDNHYERTSTEPDDWQYSMLRDRESNYEWDREGESAKWAILNAMDVSEEIAEDIRSGLEDRHYDHELAQMGEESPFSNESHYAERDAGHGEFPMLWNDFENGLKTQARFFSPAAKTILDRIFDRVAELQTTQQASVVVKAGPEMLINKLYRARVFAGEDEKLEEALKAPWKHLGTPPPQAAGAGRMNARGIAVFYGARNADTALSEVRPPVGCKVAMASFHVIRPLRLLDLTALKSVAAGGSIFDPTTIVKMQRSNFLQILSRELSRAVMPHEEASEYLSTQAVADYLANQAHLDGIIFPSIQTAQESSNVVLFHHAARIEEVELPKGTKVDVQHEMQNSDGIHPDYMVWEKVSSSSYQGQRQNQDPHWRLGMLHPFDQESDARAPTLRIDLETIHVHHVRAVYFDAPSHSVTRHRFEQTGHSHNEADTPAMDIEENFDSSFN